MERFQGCTDNDQRLKVEPGVDEDDDGGDDVDDDDVDGDDDNDGDDGDDDDGDDNDDDEDLINDKRPVGWVDKTNTYSLVASKRCVANLFI